MKLSVSLPDEDVAFIDEYAKRFGSPTRSSVLHHAVDLLRTADMESAYADAWAEWQETDDAELWDSASGDGLTDAAR